MTSQRNDAISEQSGENYVWYFDITGTNGHKHVNIYRFSYFILHDMGESGYFFCDSFPH